jgi:hypothetical protein
MNRHQFVLEYRTHSKAEWEPAVSWVSGAAFQPFPTRAMADQIRKELIEVDRMRRAEGHQYRVIKYSV